MAQDPASGVSLQRLTAPARVVPTTGLSVVTVPYLDRAPDGDGDISDLKDLPALQLEKGTVQLGWTPDRLHVAALIRDGSLVSTRQADTTSTDALVLQLGDTELLFTSARGNRPIVRRSKGGKLDRMLVHRRRGPEGTIAAVRRAEDTGDVVYELSIPWLTVSDSLPDGQAAIPFRLLVRDRQGDAVVDSEYRPGERVVLDLAPPAGQDTAIRLVAADSVIPPETDPGVAVEFYQAKPASLADVSLSLDGAPVWQGAVQVEAGRTVHEVKGLRLGPGSHRLQVSMGGKLEAQLTVVVLDRAAVGQSLAQLSQRLAKLPAGASSATAAYLIEDVKDILGRARITSVLAGRCLRQLEAIEKTLAALEAGKSPVEGQTGRLQCAHRSSLDGTLQPYSLFVPEAATVPTTAGHPLLVVLPDAGEDQNTPFETGHLQTAASRHGSLVLVPYGRTLDGTYVGASETDVREALEDVTRLARVDASRIFIAGVRAGGTGALEMGLSSPDRFRGIAAVDALPDRVGAWTHEWHKEPVSWMTALYESMSASSVAANAAGMAVFLAHHPGTPLVKAQSQTITRALTDAGAVIESMELSTPSDEGLVWERALAFFAKSSAPRPVGHITFATTRLTRNKAWWAAIDQVRVHGLTASLRGERSFTGSYKITPENVTAFSIATAGDTTEAAEAVTVSVEGQDLTTPPTAIVSLHLKNDKWAVGPVPPSTQPQKVSGVEGPIPHAFSSPFLYVYGDSGPDAAAAERAAREGARRWEQRFNGRAEARAESKLTTSDEQARNLILVGTLASSKRIRELLSAFPIRVTSQAVEVGESRFQGRTVGLQFVAPNARAPGRYLVAVTGTSAEALPLLTGHDWRKPDYLVVDSNYLEEAPQSALGGGFFDRSWKP